MKFIGTSPDIVMISTVSTNAFKSDIMRNGAKYYSELPDVIKETTNVRMIVV